MCHRGHVKPFSIDMLQLRIVITNRGGIPIHISDVGSVRFGSAKRFGAMTKDGEGECVGGIAMMLKGANANVVTKELEARVERDTFFKRTSAKSL